MTPKPRVLCVDDEPAVLEGIVLHLRRWFEVLVTALKPGMVFCEDVRSRAGTLLVARGYTVSAGLLARLWNLPPGTVNEPIRVRIDAA